VRTTRGTRLGTQQRHLAEEVALGERGQVATLLGRDGGGAVLDDVEGVARRALLDDALAVLEGLLLQRIDQLVEIGRREHRRERGAVELDGLTTRKRAAEQSDHQQCAWLGTGTAAACAPP
jgi:hypothetical protein